MNNLQYIVEELINHLKSEDELCGLVPRTSNSYRIYVITHLFLIMLAIPLLFAALFFASFIDLKGTLFCMLPMMLIFISKFPPFTWIIDKLMFKNFSIMKQLNDEYNWRNK